MAVPGGLRDVAALQDMLNICLPQAGRPHGAAGQADGADTGGHGAWKMVTSYPQ